MVTTLEFWIWIGFSLIVGLAVGSLSMEALKDRELRAKDRLMNEAILKELETKEALGKREQEFRSWQNTFDKRLERRVAEKLRDWTPSVEDADEAFRQAELMASRREMANAGRSHPPRSDAGPSVKLSRIKFRR